MTVGHVVVWVVVAGFTVLLAVPLWLRRHYLAITVTGPSMSPTYGDGERVLVRRVRTGAVRPGTVVVFAGTPDETWRGSAAEVPAKQAVIRPGAATMPRHTIKRVLAVPGDPVPREACPALRDVEESTVPAGNLVVVGDAPNLSYDSRHYGYLPAGLVVGITVRKLRLPRRPHQPMPSA
jgi:signal peptidase I